MKTVPIIRDVLFGTASIGVYIALTNEFIFLPKNTPREKIEAFSGVFGSEIGVITGLINRSSLIGMYSVCNSHGILFPNVITDSELDDFRRQLEINDYNIGLLDTADNALGNLILCNNKGAVISEVLAEHKKEIEDVLDVEAIILNYAGNHFPGSSGIANSRGCLVHPAVTDNEAELIAGVLKVEVDVSTINMGDPYIRSGAAVNDYGGIFGNKSTGPELMRITNILGI